MEEAEGRVALVTGAARGLGRAYCSALAERGLRVAACDLADTAETLRECGPTARGFRADLTDPAAVERLVGEVRQALGRIDVLVNNLGGFPVIPFTEMSLDDWRRILRLNLDSCFYVCRGVAPVMIAQGYGRIVNIASGTVFKGTSGMSAYVAAKAGVIGLTRVLSNELGTHGITANCVAPGLTDTPGAHEYLAGVGGEDANIAGRAIKRAEVPADVVGAVCFFASDDAAFITGQTLVVDGGSVNH